MSLKTNHVQSKESEKEELPLSDPFSSEKPVEIPPIQAPETAEILTKADKERVKQEILEEISAQEEKKPAAKPVPDKADQPAVKSPALVKIENILEEDLQDAYLTMDPVLQQKFKVEGEKTAIKIEKLLAEAKVKAGQIVKLIMAWLKLIPGLNRFFLNQEAKIKTDQLIKLKQGKE